MSARWQEDLHPRRPDGRFGTGAGSVAGGTADARQTARAARAGDVTARAAVTTTARPGRHGKTPDRGRDLLAWANTNAGQKIISDDAYNPNPNRPEPTTPAPYEDRKLQRIVGAQGYGLPAVGTPGQVQAAIDDGWTEIHRGVVGTADHPAEDILRSTRSNPDHILGVGVFGNGTYFTASAEVAGHFAATNVMGGGTTTKAKHPGATVRAALHPDARVIDHEDLKAERAAWVKTLAGREYTSADWYDHFTVPEGPGHDYVHPGLSTTAMDLGRYAALAGYDAIVVRGQKDGGNRRNTSKQTQYVVLNRSALLMEDTP